MTPSSQREDPLTMTYAALAPLVELEWLVQSSALHAIEIAHTHEESSIGTATWSLRTCARERGVTSLYEIWIAGQYQGVFVLLLPERRFTPYQAWMKYGNLSSEPQEALNELVQTEDALRQRHLLCISRGKYSGDLISAWQIYAQRCYWKQGRYEGGPYPYPSFVDAVRAMGRAHPEWVLVPQRIENLHCFPYPGYIDLHCVIREDRSVEEMLKQLPVGACWVGSYDNVAQIRLIAPDPTVLNRALAKLREQWGRDDLWIPVEWEGKEASSVVTADHEGKRA